MPFYAYYLREIVRPKCQICGKLATHQLMNRTNDRCGDYCEKHAKRKMEQLKAEQATREEIVTP